MFDSLGSSFGPIATYAFAAIVVFVLLLVVLAVAKRSLRPGVASASLRKGPRLAIVDVAAVDQRRKLVLVRRDDVEHLVLIGGQNDLVVEGRILRTPASVNQFGPERVASPLESGTATVASNGRPGVVAPGPRQQFDDDAPRTAASPLRRTLPQQPPRPRRGMPTEPPAEPALTNPVEPRAPTEPAFAPPAPLVEPAIVADAATAARRSAPLPPVVSTTDDERRTEPSALPTPSVSERSQRSVAAERPAQPERAAATATAQHPAIPAFLQRTDAVPEPATEEPEASLPPDPAKISAPPQPVAPPQFGASTRMPAVGRAPARADLTPPSPRESERAFANEAPTAPRVVAAPVVSVPKLDAPVRPAAPLPPPPARTEPPLAETRATVDAPVSEATAPAVEPNDDAERRPLSVRSFASAIQSRRTAPEPAPAPRPVATPAGENFPDRVRTAAPLAAAPTRETVPPVAPSVPAASSSVNDDGLDDALTRELDSNLGSLDWTGESRAAAPEVAPVARNQPAAAPTPDRKPTLEEEMERLLSDFDFGPQRR